MKLVRIVIIVAAIIAAAAITVAAGVHDKSTAAQTRAPASPTPVTLSRLRQSPTWGCTSPAYLTRTLT